MKGVWLGLILTVLGSESWAAPESEFLIEELANKRSRLDWIAETHQFASFDDGEYVTLPFKEELDVDYSLNKLYSRIVTPEGILLHSTIRGLDTVGSGNFRSVCLLLYGQTPELVVRSVQRFGVPIPLRTATVELKTAQERRALERSRVKRWNNRNSWVIGEKEAGSPQIWIEKDAFLPQRLIWNPTDSAGSLVEVRFDQYASAKSYLYPNHRVFIDGENPLFRVSVEAVSTHLKDRKRTKKIRGRAANLPRIAGWTTEGKALPSEHRAILEKFIAHFR